MGVMDLSVIILQRLIFSYNEFPKEISMSLFKDNFMFVISLNIKYTHLNLFYNFIKNMRNRKNIGLKYVLLEISIFHGQKTCLCGVSIAFC